MVVSAVPSFSAVEDLTSGSIRITDTTDWAGQGIDLTRVEIGYGIIAPDGITYRSDAVPQVGNIFPDVQLWAEFPLPTDAHGKIQAGTYVISYHVYYDIGPQTETITINAVLCTDLPTLCLTPKPDCLRLVVSVTDETNWTGWTVNSRLMTLQYPSITYHAPITSTAATVSTAGENIWNGTWTVTSELSVTKDNFTISFRTVKQFPVACDLDGCRLLCMFKKKFADLVKARERSNVKAMSDINQDLSEMASLSQMIQYSVNCGDETILDSLMARFKLVATGSSVDSDCDCCDDCSEPQPLVPIWASGGDMWTPIAGANITITPGINSYTFALSAAFAALVGDLFNTVVAAGAGIRVDVTGPVGTPPTWTYTVVNTMPAKDSIDITWNVDLETPAESLGTAVITGTYFKAPTIIESAGTNSYRVTDFLTTAVNSNFNASVWISGRELTAAMNAANRYATIIDANVLFGQWQIGTANQEFSFVLTGVGPYLGANEGSALLKSWFSGVLKKFSVRIQITKV